MINHHSIPYGLLLNFYMVYKILVFSNSAILLPIPPSTEFYVNFWFSENKQGETILFLFRLWRDLGRMKPSIDHFMVTASSTRSNRRPHESVLPNSLWMTSLPTFNFQDSHYIHSTCLRCTCTSDCGMNSLGEVP